MAIAPPDDDLKHTRVDSTTARGSTEKRQSLPEHSRLIGTGDDYDAKRIENGESSKSNDVQTNSTDNDLTFDDKLRESTSSSHKLNPKKHGSQKISGRGSHRSHRNKNSSGGFLLSKATFEPPLHTGGNSEGNSSRKGLPYDSKGKSPIRTPERRIRGKGSAIGLGIGGSPLASNITSANATPTGSNEGGDVVMEQGDNEEVSKVINGQNENKTFDIDSAQIVNLALNLSESRRIAARRVTSSPLPPVYPALGESIAGGSLRQHLQQQRRISRNISPRPDRGERAATGSPRGTSNQQSTNVHQPAFQPDEDIDYKYYITPSTLARARKAKETIELMAEYRRLLQYVPPLKPQIATKASNVASSGVTAESPTHSTFPLSRSATASVTSRSLGRPYNPLQYVRNRKVRARERKDFDGAAQGFGDLGKVSTWVDEIVKASDGIAYQTSDSVNLPAFSKAADAGLSPTTSPKQNQQPAIKVKRPRIDWITSPADMLADVLWLEQDDHKKLIEDHEGRKIFPLQLELKRRMSQKVEEPFARHSIDIEVKREQSDSDYHVDKDLPAFKSVKNDLDRGKDRGRARQKLYDATHFQHGHNASGHDRHLWQSHSRSESDISDSEGDKHSSRHRRANTLDRRDRSSDILEKQMLAMLAKEAEGNETTISHQSNEDEIGQSIEQRDRTSSGDSRKKQAAYDENKDDQARIASKEADSRKGSIRFIGDGPPSSGRQSLEVPRARGRSSLEYADPFAQNVTPTRVGHSSRNSITQLDFSPTQSRQSSPVRRPTTGVRSKLQSLRDRDKSQDPSRQQRQEKAQQVEDNHHKQNVERNEKSDTFQRASSPLRHYPHHRLKDSLDTSSTRPGSFRKPEVELTGLRGLLKAGKSNLEDIVRSPVTRVSDLLWRKEAPPGSPHASSDDESEYDGTDIQDVKQTKPGLSKTSSDDDNLPKKQRNKVIEPTHRSDLPSFTLPMNSRNYHEKNRGSSSYKGDSTAPPSPDSRRPIMTKQPSRFHSLKPPRIDVHHPSPLSSPDVPPLQRRLSDVSDLEWSRRGSTNVKTAAADARLRSALDFPGGIGRTGLPVTGLRKLGIDKDAYLSVGEHPMSSKSRSGSAASSRHWSIYDSRTTKRPDFGSSDCRTGDGQAPSFTRQDVIRVRTLLLSSGIKAKELTRRATECTRLDKSKKKLYRDIASLAPDPEKLGAVPMGQEHIYAGRVLSGEIYGQGRKTRVEIDDWVGMIEKEILGKVKILGIQISGEVGQHDKDKANMQDDPGLAVRTRRAADEADEVSRELVGTRTLEVKRLNDKMEKMSRRRRRRFRWIRRGGWVLVEWMLVGVMWWVWLVVVVVRITRGTIGGIFRFLKWLFWL